MTADTEPAFDTVPPWQGFVLAAFVIPLDFALSQLLNEGVAWVAAVSAISIGASVRISWPMRKRSWFWATVILVTLLHVSLIFISEWQTDGFPSLMLWPVAIADIFLILSAFALVSRKFSTTR